MPRPRKITNEENIDTEESNEELPKEVVERMIAAAKKEYENVIEGNTSNKRGIRFNVEGRTYKAQGNEALPAKVIEEWFVKDNPYYQINTELIIINENIVVWKATVTDADGNSATGSCEVYINSAPKDKEFRKNESKAIARACQRLGYGINYAYEEDDEVESEPQIEYASKAQIKQMRDLLVESEIDEKDFNVFMGKELGYISLEDVPSNKVKGVLNIIRESIKAEENNKETEEEDEIYP